MKEKVEYLKEEPFRAFSEVRVAFHEVIDSL